MKTTAAVIEGGDSVKFGHEWCKWNERPDLLNRTLKMLPQWFQEDNGLYCYDQITPGIWNEDEDEPDSIYHLFGNRLERFMDCTLIKGNESDKQEYKRIIQEKNEEEAENLAGMAEFFMNQQTESEEENE